MDKGFSLAPGTRREPQDSEGTFGSNSHRDQPGSLAGEHGKRPGA